MANVSEEAKARKRIYQREYQKQTREKQNEYRKRWQEKNPVKHIRQRIKDGKSEKHKLWIKNNPARYLMYKYGVSLTEAERLLSIKACEACGRKLMTRTQQHIDHDHKTGKIRGVLCSGCNHAIGRVEESVERLHAIIQYLGQRRG